MELTNTVMELSKRLWEVGIVFKTLTEERSLERLPKRDEGWKSRNKQTRVLSLKPCMLAAHISIPLVHLLLWDVTEMVRFKMIYSERVLGSN